MTKATWLGASLLVISLSVCTQTSGQSTLACVAPPNPTGREESVPIEQRSPQENANLHRSPHGAKRITRRQVEVRWTAGTRIFRDKPPFDQPLDGVKWTYCGYDPAVQLHLLGKKDIDVFTGTLLDDKTGALLPGGEVVEFSPGQTRYLAYEQPDGQDGETIKLYNRDGTLLWKGFNGLLSPDRKYVVAAFQSIHWGDHEQLVAEVESSGIHRKSFILTLGGGGKWTWLPARSK